MAKREWVGEYVMGISIYLPHNDNWVERVISLGKCLSWDEAGEKAIITLTRDYMGQVVKPIYIQDGWGNRKLA